MSQATHVFHPVLSSPGMNSQAKKLLWSIM